MKKIEMKGMSERKSKGEKAKEKKKK